MTPTVTIPRMKTSFTPQELHQIGTDAYEAAHGKGRVRDYDQLTDGTKRSYEAIAEAVNRALLAQPQPELTNIDQLLNQVGEGGMLGTAVRLGAEFRKSRGRAQELEQAIQEHRRDYMANCDYEPGIRQKALWSHVEACPGGGA